MDEFEKNIFENLDLYRELTEKYKSRKIDLDPEEMLEKINKAKDNTRGDKLYSYKFDENNILYDSNFYYIGNRGAFDIQGLIYISNSKQAKVVQKYNLGLGQYKRNIVDITQTIPIDEKIEDFLLRNFQTRTDYDNYTYKWNATRKASGVRKNGKLAATFKDTYDEVKFDDEVYKKKREEIEAEAKKFSDKLIAEFGLDKLPDEMDKVAKITEELDKSISEGGNNVNKTLKKTSELFDYLKDTAEDVVDDVKDVVDDVVDAAQEAAKVASNSYNDIGNFLKNFLDSIKTILELIIKLIKMGLKTTEFILIISPILVIVYTFYKINMSLYHIEDNGKEETDST